MITGLVDHQEPQVSDTEPLGIPQMLNQPPRCGHHNVGA
jgi:hypothetical protein